MKPITLSPREATVLAALAGFGLLVPNGVFLWYFFARPETVRSAFANPVALVFIGEAFLLMFLFAWLLGRLGSRRPTRWSFVGLSLLGSLAFSVPLALWLNFRGKDIDQR
jgi:Na+/citrate or Na+/malate symporter